MNVERFLTLTLRGIAVSYTDGLALLTAVINGLAEAEADSRDGQSNEVRATAGENAELAALLAKLCRMSETLRELDDDGVRDLYILANEIS